MGSQDSSHPAEFDGEGVADLNHRNPSVVQTVADLVLVFVVVGTTLALALRYGELGGPAPLRVPLGFLFIFFLPGYALTAVLFPYAVGSGNRQSGTLTVTAVERVVLSVGLSLVLVPLVSLGLTLISQPIELFSVLVSIGALTAVLCVIAAFRRLTAPPAERYFVTPRPAVASTVDFLRTDTLNVVLVVVLVLSAGGIGVAIITAEDATTFSEFALLVEDDGDLVAGEYPTELSVDESQQFYVEITNNEGETIEYTLVVLLEDLDTDGEPMTATELDRTTVALEHNERTLEEHEFQPTDEGENLRLLYLLYVDEVPDQPTLTNAYQSTHVTLDVEG